ncbi:MAG: phosphatase [Panacagrimonas sp.]|jgi:N-acylneuraminate cytidylyltransferase|nr:N-acylneuraminate cytidylyltransferase [Panacagrimonas sp.]MCC2656473.1 phosphatase [Panacagrimonas sp.]
MAMRWVALQPLRGGSKTIPDKNLRIIAGRPLYAWSLGAALDSGCFDAIYVASDSAEIRGDVRARFGSRVNVIDRAPENATDDASSESVMLEVAAKVSCDVMSLIQATSPLTRPEDFRIARARFEREGLDSLLTGVELKRFFWTHDAQPLNYDPARRPRRQDFPATLMENGAFYFTRSQLLTRTGSRLCGRIGVYRMHEESAAELDELSDWPIVESLLRRRFTVSRDIRMIVVDVDGTFTDGGMYYDAKGEALKKFDTRDAKGLLLLQEAGVRICIVTAEDSKVVHARMRKLGFEDYFPGVKDKPAWLAEAGERWQVSLEQTAYIGDDVNDLACLRIVGLSACPADAVPEVRDAVKYICGAPGGRGAVREFSDMIRAHVVAKAEGSNGSVSK